MFSILGRACIKWNHLTILVSLDKLELEQVDQAPEFINRNVDWDMNLNKTYIKNSTAILMVQILTFSVTVTQHEGKVMI